MNAAHVICRDMGLTEAKTWRSAAVNGSDVSYKWKLQDNLHIALDDVICEAGVKEWEECTFTTTDTSNCIHREDVFLSCKGERIF